MGSKPIGPATIRATAQRVVDEWAARDPRYETFTHSCFSENQRNRFVALVQAGADLAAQSLADAEREAARKAWDAAREYWWEHGFNGRGGVDIARNTYLAREYPETRECVLSDGCRITFDREANVLRRMGAHRAELSRIRVCWMELLHEDHTGADWDKLKAFAEAVR